MKHSSYTYQKLFRALYGYTQAVFKSNGKIYHYHRLGVLSSTPYIRPGKNCVIIPPGKFQRLLEFFKTGRNPSHNWKGKGEWKAVYYMNEKDVSEKAAVRALEDQLDRHFVPTESGRKEKLSNQLTVVINKPPPKELGRSYLGLLLNEAQSITANDWFKTVHSQSEKLASFYSNYKKLKAVSV